MHLIIGWLDIPPPDNARIGYMARQDKTHKGRRKRGSKKRRARRKNRKK